MSEPTISLATARRTICKELKMPFFRRYSAGFLDADSGSTTTLIDSVLTQIDKFWVQSWVYRVASQEASQIVRFTNADHQLVFETPITALVSGDDYEIHALWNAYEIHEALNEAIRNVRRIFRDVVVDETLIVQEDKRAYALTGLAKAPYLIHKIWMEQPQTVRRGTLVAGGASTFTVENSGILTGVNSNWKVSIYDGTGKGQLRSVSSVLGAVGTNSSPWDTVPDSTSKYALWDASEETFDWYPFKATYLSSKEFPDTLYLSYRPVDFYGMRIRIQYSALASEFTTEASTTVIPLEYLKHAAISILHSQKIPDNKSDRDLHFAEWKRHEEIAKGYLALNTPHMPDTAIESNPEHFYEPTAFDPLNWGQS